MSANPMQLIRRDEAREGVEVRNIRAIPERNGKCFHFALSALIDAWNAGSRDTKLVHGVITGYHQNRVESGHELRIAHAWLERSDMVYEATMDVTFYLPDFYRCVDAVAERQYSYEEARAMCLISSRIGPWHETAGVFT